MAAAKQDLSKIGKDAFFLLEDFINNKGKKPYPLQRQGPQRGTRRANLRPYQPEQNPLLQINPKASAVEKTNTFDVVKFRAEASTAEFSIKNSALMLKEDLVRIGKEGFDIIDQLYENKGRKGGAARKPPPHALPKGRQACLYQYQPQQSHVYMVNPYEKMKTHEVVQFNDGVTDMDYTKRTSAPKFY
ncbi:hypothetical protein AAHA92_16397 [Salvia divinorum]|uniref:Uncharacterized protein n=1 Tax=Salvia divinorum TaxID=28513 RepID=A0ABD1GVI3_SALDI